MKMTDEDFGTFASQFDSDKADRDEIINYLKEKGVDYDDEDLEDLIKAAESGVLSKVDAAGDKAAAATLGMTGKAAAAMNGEAYFPDPQQMANEDSSEVTVTEEDKDNDGDTDKVTVEKETPSDDDEARAAAEKFFADVDEDVAEDDNSSEADDKPQLSEGNKTNQFARTLSELR